MKFDDKYPDAKYPEQHGDMLCGETLLPCWNCGEPTRWYEINYEAPLCSEECVAQKDREYQKALRINPRGVPKTSSSRLRTRLFDLEEGHDMKKLAYLFKLSMSEIYRVRQGKRGIGERFIVGALTSFPEYKFEELFYIENG